MKNITQTARGSVITLRTPLTNHLFRHVTIQKGTSTPPGDRARPRLIGKFVPSAHERVPRDDERLEDRTSDR